ncbi:hypothetical protein EJ08DRAFT_600533, partial [Tothia fuscella]
AQTPQQRKANAKFAKVEEEKRGKPVQLKKREKQKSPYGPAVLALMAFVVCGGVIFEILRIWF